LLKNDLLDHWNGRKIEGQNAAPWQTGCRALQYSKKPPNEPQIGSRCVPVSTEGLWAGCIGVQALCQGAMYPRRLQEECGYIETEQEGASASLKSRLVSIGMRISVPLSSNAKTSWLRSEYCLKVIYNLLSCSYFTLIL